jgi:hypothetical protein
MTSVWATDLPLAEKMVFLSLADNANDEGVCWPSIGTICKKTSLSDRAVQKCIGRLKDKGLLSIKGRNGHSNVFSLHLTTRHVDHGLEDIGLYNTLIHTPEPRSPPPQNVVRGTPEPRSPRIIKESSFEPSEVFRKLLKTGGKEPKRTPEIQKAIDAVGGWPKIRNVTEYDLPQAERAFCAAMKGMQ